MHSYLILTYTDHDKVAMNVSIYYTANACGRLVGTLLSGWLYQVGARSGTHDGLVWCLAASSIFPVAAGAVSLALPRSLKTASNED